MEEFMTLRKKRNWLCKSDINSVSLMNMGLGCYSVKLAKEVFDNLYVDDKYVKYFLTGSEYNRNQTRHTKFVNKFYFYRVLVKGYKR